MAAGERARDFTGFGPNVGLVEELYRQYLADPQSVGAAWRDFFADYEPRTAPSPAPPVPPATRPPHAAAAPVLEGDETTPLRGAQARLAENMEASLRVPTATSVREVPAKLLEVNRLILNNSLARTRGGKVSFTHLIAFAVLEAIRRVPAMNSGYTVVDGVPTRVRHAHVNLGLAVDLERPDGTRTLVVPCVKQADTLSFAEFFGAYEDLVHRARTNALTPEDFAGTTVSITNPGTIGTVHSVPRLMPGQGLIVGVGAIGYPAAYEGADPEVLARLGVSKTITLTSTYDHRVIQGAESGEFLGHVHRFLLGEEGFYDEVFRSLEVPYEPARWARDVNPLDDARGRLEKQSRVDHLVNMYRVRGHLIADLDPLQLREPHTHAELDPNFWGLSIWDLDREFLAGGIGGGDGTAQVMTLREILGVMRDAYARTIGIEYMHIQEPAQKAWIQERVEGVPWELPIEAKRRILEKLNAAEAFERFLNTKYLGHKRFGIDGSETLVPMLDALLSEAAEAGFEEVVLGMAHRGRLNVLANVVGKSYGQIFREFEGDLDPTTTQGSGDVKYHVGATGKHVAPSGAEVRITLASNPSHLEAVDPVVEGMTRARQERHGGGGRVDAVLPVLVHGDAAFAGQGVVAETFNLSALPGYGVGGTVHLVVNNQVGFTTAPSAGRSSVYATDVAKMVQAPIFHVNGDDPEACVRVIALAFGFRQAFHKDVVVDMWCYRRFGHNEADEPSFTQPRMYARIEERRSVRKRYTEQLVNRGDLSLEEAEAALHDFQRRLDAAFEETRQSEPPAPESGAVLPDVDEPVATGVEHATLDRIVRAVTTVPEGFTVHPKLGRLMESHARAFEQGWVDWSLAEHLAFGSLLLEGHPVRVAGQDTRRGTFSQRHAVLVDHETEEEYVPLAHLGDGDGAEPAPFRIYDSLLSEYAALGFEYGYSVSHPEALVCWEAQFGDFVNGGQIIVDQFLVAAEDKWSQTSGLVLLLPHGYEGQGPEHSSARLERFLTLCAQDNMRVVQPSTAAQYFHVLRRQKHVAVVKPLVVLTPKRYLRMPHTRSAVEELVGGRFHEVLDDRGVDAPAVRRVLLCTGKIGHELMDARDERRAPASVVRVEQLYPFRGDAILGALRRYPNATEVVWVQDEPENMGAWRFVHAALGRVLPDGLALRHVSRPESGSPATGSQTVHQREQAELLDAAFAGL